MRESSSPSTGGAVRCVKASNERASRLATRLEHQAPVAPPALRVIAAVSLIKTGDFGR